MIALEVDGVKKSFRSRRGTVDAVRGVSFCVEAGEVFGLLGMNGAGKSTTIKMCTGLLEPDGGQISVFGNDIVRDCEKAKSMLNISPQETAVAPALSVEENLIFTARIYGAGRSEAKRAAVEVMERLRLSDRAADRAGKLSGGLMRRLSVGMALITEPKLIFLDEPTLGLDVVARRELWKFIRDVSATAAVVLTTHYLEEAESLCNRIAVMSEGRIAAVGSAAELIEKSGESNFENAFLRLSGAGEFVNE